MPSPSRAVNLRCEYQRAPLGIDEPNPRFSWIMEDKRRGAKQTAYQIIVRKGESTVWDSGMVRSDQSIHVVYKGKKLQPRTRYEWQVRICDHQGQWSEWSDSAAFETGLMGTKEWRAQWIEAVRDDIGSMRPAAYLRKEFIIEKPIVRARLYATALGVYEAHINGVRVGDRYMTPGWTKYEKRVQYQTYDVTNMVTQGANAVGAIIAEGWYCGEICGAWEKDKKKTYGPQPRFRAELIVDHPDGTVTSLATDPTWKFTTGPIEYSDIYMGERYDARKELGAWSSPGYDDSTWRATREVVGRLPFVVAQMGPPVRIMKEIRPVGITQPQPGVWVINMGQNMVGWECLRVQGPAGTEITVRHAEMLNPDGTIYTANLRRAKATSIYVLKGDGVEILHPHFTFYGFQYLELTGFPGKPELDSITGMVLHSDMEQTGSFECSDKLVNQLQHNIEWGQRGNYFDIPTDCPQRDERLGWTGDAQVFCRTAAFNFDIASFFTKWLYDLNDSQSSDGRYPNVAPELPEGEPAGVAAWADAGVICPWVIYRCYGDTRILERHFANMKKWVDHQRTSSKNLIFDRSWFGDWLNINAHTPGDLIGTAFFAYSAELVSRIAAVLGKKAEAKKYASLAARVRAAFNAEFVTPNGRVVGETQTGAILALHFNLVPQSKRARILDWLVKDIKSRGNHLSCGFVGSPYINHVLTDGGRDDVAYTLLFQTGWPSWLYAVTQGATTIWERWDGWTHDKGFQDPGMNSFNHYAYGAIGDWLYSKVAGIDLDPSVPAYKRIIIEPHPSEKLSYAKAVLRSPYGEIVSGWRREGMSMVYEIAIPANTTASIRLPGTRPERIREGKVSVGKTGTVKVRGIKNGRVELDVGAGSYTFVVR